MYLPKRHFVIVIVAVAVRRTGVAVFSRTSPATPALHCHSAFPSPSAFSF